MGPLTEAQIENHILVVYNNGTGYFPAHKVMSQLDMSFLVFVFRVSEIGALCNYGKKEKVLTLSQKVDVIAAGKQPGVTRQQFGVSRQIVNLIWMQKSDLESRFQSGQGNANKKRNSPGTFSELEEIIFLWFKEKRAQGVLPSGVLLRQKAVDLAQTTKIEGFQQNDGVRLRKIIASTSVRLREIIASTSVRLREIIASTSVRLREIIASTSVRLREIIASTSVRLREIIASTSVRLRKIIAPINLLKKKSILSGKTKLVLVVKEDLRKDIMDTVTEGDKLLLITEKSQNKSNSSSFLTEFLIWKNDGSATFTNARDDEIIFPPSTNNFGGRTFLATLLTKNNDKLAIQVLNILSQVLNFSLAFPDPPADSYGTKDYAGVWGGAVGQLARKERDVAGIQLSWTAERNAVIDFAEFYQLAALMFGSRAPRQFPRSGALFRLFGVEVWVAYFFASLLSGGIVAATWMFYLFKINPKEGATSSFSILQLSLEASLKISLWQGVEKLPSNIGSRIVFAIWAVACLIVLSVYCGNIRAFLSIKETEQPLDTVAQVLKGNVPAYYYPGTSTESFLRETSFSLVHELWKKNKNNNKERMNPNQYLDLMSNGGILLATNVNLEKLFQQFEESSGRSCPFYLGKQRLKEDYLCLGLQKNSPFLEPMSYRIRDFKRGGIIQFWQERIIEEQVIKEGSCDPRLRSNKDQTNILLSLSLNDVIVSFQLLLSGYVMSIVTFCVEYLIGRFKINQNVPK
ncbi:glutamate receptor 2-like [Limulus polyphemus]|uniref:Glutamate receptor 2-like n=1 Tax=Limulus polyphemus TaxID=6850 RepID=A0ABM1TIE2_LIMPO|nr:glutamate receptor 2-like [Limulus polyphemus]